MYRVILSGAPITTIGLLNQDKIAKVYIHNIYKLYLIYGERSSVGRAPDCDSGRRGFESHRSPHFIGPLAQLVEQGTLNPKVEGSIPSRPTI